MFDFNDDFFKITLRALNLNKLQRHEQQFYARVKKKTFEMLFDTNIFCIFAPHFRKGKG